ncbi:MAG: MBL fold metallo-hydrolase [Sneathiella sp.]
MKKVKLVNGMLVGMGLFMLALATTPSQATSIKDNPSLDITWLGGPTMVLEFNGVRLLTDPIFGEGDKAFLMGDPNEMFDLKKGPNVKHHKRLTKFPKEEASQIDHLILSHAHEDHFDQKAQKTLSKNIPTILAVADAEKVKAMGFLKTTAMAWGKSTTLKAGDGSITITAIPAMHSADEAISSILGKGNGYWFEFKQGNWRKTVYWTGDSFPTESVKASLKNFGKPDIFIPHLGKVGTSGPLGQISMSGADVALWVNQLEPTKILPIHHSSLALYLEPIGELVTALKGSSAGLDLISEGSTLHYH